MARQRADLLLVARGLAESRAKAQATIAAGGVTADGAVVAKASDMLDENVVLNVAPPHPWVSRGGVKLAAALEKFAIDPAARICLDVGASTGGFTDVLLTRGATRIYAVDVGQGQLHRRLAQDARVINLEKTDARTLTRDLIPDQPSLVVCDASFIGAEKVLTRPLSLAAAKADLIALIKPQFEAGPGRGDKNGVLDEKEAREVGLVVVQRLEGLQGFRGVSVIDSPIRGGEGNLEFLLHARRT